MRQASFMSKFGIARRRRASLSGSVSICADLTAAQVGPHGPEEPRGLRVACRLSPAPIARRRRIALLHGVVLPLIIGAAIVRLATTALPRIGLRLRLGLPEETKAFAAPGAAFRH